MFNFLKCLIKGHDWKLEYVDGVFHDYICTRCKCQKREGPPGSDKKPIRGN